MPDRYIGLDLDGVLRHNNITLERGDIPIEWRTREKLTWLYKTNRLPDRYYILEPNKVRFITGVHESLALFKTLDIRQAVFTNQEAIGLGIMSEEDWHVIRECMNNTIEGFGGSIDLWNWCPHFPDESCECRKPKPGMLTGFAKKYDVDLSQMVFIGDNPSDMEAAHKAGCGYKIHIVLEGADPEFQYSEYADDTAESLHDAAVGILNWIFQV